MTRKVNVPRPFLHKATGQDAVVLREAYGKRRTVYLGKHGTADAAQRYREVVALHLSGKPVPSARPRKKQPVSEWPTVGQLAATYLVHATRFYVDEVGKQTGETYHAKIAFTKLLELLRDRPTDRVTVRDLLAVRQALVDARPVHKAGKPVPNGLSRRTINDRMGRCKRLFRWGAEQGMVPGTTWHELSALRGLPKGRCGVHDNPPVEAVPWSLVEATLPHLVPTVRDAVLVQWWTGARPAEVLAMTRRQLDMGGETWLVVLEFDGRHRTGVVVRCGLL